MTQCKPGAPGNLGDGSHRAVIDDDRICAPGGGYDCHMGHMGHMGHMARYRVECQILTPHIIGVEHYWHKKFNGVAHGYS